MGDVQEADIISYQARSKEGRGLSVRGGDSDKWITIQKNTFTNWVNIQIQETGHSVSNLQEDFCDGIRLCALVSALQQKQIGRVIKKPVNQHQMLENVTLALNAIAADNVRLVNIGSEDIVNGSLKLILGLIWHLILRYQIGKSKLPAKKLMLAWLKAVVPDCQISNFTSDWNDGVNLHAVIDYCQPGLCPNWRQLNRANKLDNCRDAMMLAKDKFAIPLVVRPEDLSSPHLDDLSGMTYLSYFMNIDSPGYHATLRNVNALMTQGHIKDFTSSWNDGSQLINLVKSLGQNPGAVTTDHVDNLKRGIESGRRLGVEPILTAKEIAEADKEHLGIMAYAAYFTHLKPVKSLADKATIDGNFQNVYVGQEKTFRLNIDDDVSAGDFRAEVIGPDSIPPVRLNWSGRTATGSFTPSEMGQHRLNVYCRNEPLNSCPIPFKVSSDRSKVTFKPVDKCPVGVITELKVDTSSAGQGDVRMEVETPSGKVTSLPVAYRSGVYTANFTPAEVGDHRVTVQYDNEHISGSPFIVKAYDPSMVKVFGLEGGSVGRALSFTADSQMAGDGELSCTVTHAGQTIPSYITAQNNNVHNVDFTPQGAGVYKVNMYYNNVEIRGSPYTLEIVDSSMVSVSGDGLSLVPVNKTANFNVQTRGAGGGNISVDITSPSGKNVQSRLVHKGGGSTMVEYIPQETGDYEIAVSYNNEPIRGSPFVCKVYDVGKVIVSNMPKVCPPNSSVMFDIDASRAGSGNIEIRVNEGRVACSVENRGNHQFIASFQPENTQPHSVEMTFNDTPVDDSPWTVRIIDPNSIKVSGNGLDRVPINTQAFFVITSTDVDISNITIHVKAPDGSTTPCNVHVDSGGVTVAEYIPRSVGDHTIKVMYNDTEIADSPFVAKAYDTSAITVTQPPDGIVSQPMNFEIDVSQAGEGQLQIMVNNGNLPNDVEMEQTGVYKISFTPVEPGIQTVDISFNDEPLPVSPLTCNAVDASASIIDIPSLQPINEESHFLIRSAAPNLSSEVEITAPSGQVVPARIIGNGTSGYTVEYTPREIGTYVVKASLSGVAIKGSPFRVKTYDPSLVKVSKMPQGVVGTPTKFIVDASAAGEGTLELAISANGRNIPNQARALGGGRFEVSFLGREALRHQAVITYNGQHVPGSPFMINFMDAGNISVSGDGLSLVPCHRATHFNINAPGAALPDFNIRLTAPDGRDVPVRIRDVKGDQNYRIEWTPTMIGDHKAVIEYADMPIKGSPFTVKAFDAANVKVSKIPQGFLGRPNSFTLDASEAGDGNLEIQIVAEGESVPNYVRQDSDTNFRVSFTPQRPNKHLINVRFNGDPVPGSPFVCPVMDSDRIHVSGEGIKNVPANVLASFKVDPEGAGDGDLNVRVYSPSGHEIPARVSGNAHSAFRVDYTPHEIGLHKVHVEYGGVEVKGSPFTSNVFDPSLIKVNSPGRAYLGRPVHFQIDTSAAGTGELEAEVNCRGSNVSSHIREIGRNRYELTFTPRDLSMHIVTLAFNKYPLPGSPYHVEVIDSNSVTLSGEGLRTAQVYKETWFNLDLHGMDENDLDVHITSPSGNEIPCRLSKKGHVCRAEYTPLEVGQHVIDVFFAGTRLTGSPYISQAYDPSLVRITDVDKTSNKKEREIAFTVDASKAGIGDLDSVVTHHGRTVHTYRETIGDGRYRYTFTPAETGHYDVNVKFNDEQIPGCPLIINVEEEHPTFITINFRSFEALNARDQNHFTLHMDGHQVDKDALHIGIKAPNGEQIPANLVRQADGDYKVEWTPNMAGRHSVDVLFSGQQIAGSPFFINVFDINKIRVDSFYNGSVGDTAGFNVDYSQAGKADQVVRVVSPSGRNVPVDVQEHRVNEYAVSYVPQEVGQHKIHLTYGSMEHPGSPFTQEIGEGALPTAHGDGLYRGEEDKPATFYVEASGMTGEPNIQVDGPNSIAKCSIDPQPGGRYAVTYVPVETGLFDITVKWNGREIHGSPFHPKIVDARKVRVIGGWQHYMDSQERIHLNVGEEKRIPFETAEAGPGKLTAEVRGPSGAIVPCTVDDGVIGKSTVIFTPREEGNHFIHLNWSDHPLSSSPFTGYAVGGHHDITKIILSGRGLKEATVREEAEFFIDGSKAGRGNPEVQLTGVRAEVNVVATPLGGGKYRCTYIPVIPGAYLLHITWNGRQVKGAPFKVNVIGAFYPNKVVVSGEGLKGGLMGRDFDVRIDTRKAGPGELTAFCSGPNKVAFCDLEDNRDGTFRLIIRPTEPGRHVLQVKYGGEHVLGSPFVFRVSAQPDASKVRVSGPGVEHGILATFQSRFIVETRGAGAGQLMVRIRGPKGAFQVEMYRDSQKDRTILCRYDPTETGLYIIHIRWSNVDVPGSPFHVHIVDTQQELEQVLQDQSYSSSTLPSARSYNQWRDEF